MRYEIVSKKEYPVYSREEADELGLSYKHPFYVEKGEYGISDDHEVGICLYKKTMTSGGRITIKVKYPWGPSFIRSDKGKIKSIGRPNNYGEPAPHKRSKSIKKRMDFKKLATLMAQPGMTTKDAIKLVFGNIKDSKLWSIKKKIKTEVFTQMTKEELQKIVEEFPIGRQDTARALSAILTQAMDYDDETGKPGKKYDSKAALAIADKLMDMNDMKGKGKVVVTQQLEGSTVETTLKDIQEKKKMFKATQTEVTDGILQGSEQKEEQVSKEKEE